jgi:hypothetical protein
MGLSRLDNFLKNTKGTILYVDPSSIDATDGVENQGNSLTRPFKTIQRALVEAARFSYQKGRDNDRFGKTTILLYPGEHLVDNRPGYLVNNINDYTLRNGGTTNDLSPFDSQTNFDLATEDNTLYKLNSIHGGVIVPRGTSIVGLDLRKTKIRPKYVPNPENDNIERSCIFRVTGSCYIWQFSIFDADPNDVVYKDYTSNVFVPNFSHHKLSCFEYADGVNKVEIEDAFLSYYSEKTDLDMYYEKVGAVYGSTSGRALPPEFVGDPIDIQTKIDEFRIVGSKGAEIGITSIRSGDGITPTTTITVDLQTNDAGLQVDTPIRVEGVNAPGYDGQYVLSEVISNTQVKYKVQNSPLDPLPSVSGATLSILVDTVTSSSPYIFNISLRSVYGMCGMLADGEKADGFKSMVVAQFTGIGLQKDNNAFVKYNSTSGTFNDKTASGNENIHTDSRARYKPTYSNFHIKATNNAFIQVVSVFAIGYAQHFIAEDGGDLSITNSNSNFGAKALVASGYQKEAFRRDDVGYITHIIPPRELETTETSVEFLSIDIAKTVSIASTNRLYLYNETNQSSPPEGVIEGYRIGSKRNENLNVLFSSGGISTQYSARVIMPNTQFTSSETTSEKIFVVDRSVTGINSITSNVITLNQTHSFINGESVRVISETGQIPDGISNNQIYYAITSGSNISNGKQLKLAQTLNDAINDDEITINSKGGILQVISRVSDKKSGDIGHPIQWDGSQWYINVATASTENSIYPTIISAGTTSLGQASPRTFITRKPDNRSLDDTIYRVRYVIPSDSTIVSRPPVEGYVIQESNTSIGSTDSEVAYQFNPSSASLSNSTELRNFRIISNASWNIGTANILTEIPHNLKVGSEVEINNITSSNNTTGIANTGFNGTFTVTGISSSKHFSIALSKDPGSYTNNNSSRNVSLPYFKKKRYSGTYYIYKSQEVQEYISGKQDGIYHLHIVNSSNSPTSSPFTGYRFSQPLQNLYPQLDRDNPISDPQSATCFALSEPAGQVIVNNSQYSITKETIEKLSHDNNIGIGLTNIISNVAGTAHTFFTSYDHGLNGITKVGIVSSGYAYGSGSSGTLYNARLVGLAGSVTGINATARISFDTAGKLTNVFIINGGSGYGIGNSLAVVGVATTSGHIIGIVSVTATTNNINDTLVLSGISSLSYKDYNTSYRITGISTRTITVESSSPISGVSTITGIGITASLYSEAILTGKTLGITTIAYNPVTGLATVTTDQNHGLFTNNKVRFSGANSSVFNGDFVIKSVVGLTTFIANIGVGTANYDTSGTKYLYRLGYTSNAGIIKRDDENLSGRLISEYAGITTTLQSTISSQTTTTISIVNVENLNLQIGDFLQINDEILRIKTTVTGNPVTVFRGVLGSRRQTHEAGSVIRRIRPIPVELRRNSIIRASGHTFEYVGYGPGNYSSSLPERQDRQITPQEEILSQSTKIDGGINYYNGMNDKGITYSGNKKVNSSTGQEEVFDTPIATVVGEDIISNDINVGFNVINPLEATISRSIRVEGGIDGNIISKFDGPVVFNNKLTSNSTKGIEASSLLLQGDVQVSRKYTVGISTPTAASNPGDVVYNGNPLSGGSVGWIYTQNNRWETFGNIADNGLLTNFLTIGISSNYNYVGLATLINFVGTGISIAHYYDNTTGITTLTFFSSSVAPATLNVAGVSTFNNNSIFNSGINVVSGVSTFSDPVNFAKEVNLSQRLIANNIRSTGITTLPNLDLSTVISGITTFNGDVSIGSSTRASDSYVRVLAGDNNIAGFEAHGSVQGTGYMFVGQSSIYGGGVYYNGDGTPGFATGETSDEISFYRKDNSTNEVVFSYPYNSNSVTFRGSITAPFVSVSGIVTASDFNSSSDINLKKNIEPLQNSLDKIAQLQGVSFEWKSTEEKSIGLIAQEVEKIFPEMIGESEDGFKTIRYNNLIAVLIEAVKELREEVNELKKQ